VLGPSLAAGVEERDELSSQRVERDHSGTLAAVAGRAGQPQVRFLCQTAKRNGEKVVDFEGRSYKRFGSKAITTPMARLRGHAVSQDSGDVN
jgi:hypothetical protein